MSSTVSTIEELRRRIDELDDQVHDLLIRRAEIVEEIGRLKKIDTALPLRPGREAQILRRLAAQHRGRLPLGTLMRVWRELMSGMLAMQADFVVAVYVPDEVPGYWDLARDHFGSHTPMNAYRSVGEVVRAVGEGRATIGVLPIPEEGNGTDPWWRHIGASGAPTPRVLARLPFASRGNARSEGRDALVIGRGEPDGSGDDCSLLVIEASADVSRTRLISALTGAGLTVTLFAAADGNSDVAANLVGIGDLIEPADPRLLGALAPLGDKVLRVSSLGSYPRPMTSTPSGERGGR